MPKVETIWIIGASEGIGASLARAWAQRGARLILSARSSSRLEEMVANLGGGHVAIPLDVTDRASIDAAVTQIDLVGPLDRVVHLAAMYDPGKIADLQQNTAAQSY